MLDRHFDVRRIEPGRRPDSLPSQDRNRVAAIVTKGSIGITAGEIAAFPALTLICALGTGTENIDVAAATARGIAVRNGGGANAACVADHAMAMILAMLRALPQGDRAAREGRWQDGVVPRQVAGTRLGILGLGNVGRAIADRATVFGIEVGFWNRSARHAATLHRLDDIDALAEWSDVAVSTLPAAPDTEHVLGRPFFTGLGAAGHFVNVGRGSVVDTAALIHALESGAIAGAALDVFEEEPNIPPELRMMSNVLLTPHVAGRSPATHHMLAQRALANLTRHFAISVPD